jgi:protein CpxP
MKDRRVTNILLLVLLVFNVGFLGSWWYGHMQAHKMMREMHEHFSGHDSKASMFLIKELGLNDEQQKQLEVLRKEHFQKIETMEGTIVKYEKGMMNAIMANPVDSNLANKYSDSVGMMKAAIQKELFRHFSSIKKICTPEQSNKFDRLVEEMSKAHHWDTHHSSEEMHHDSM